MPNPTISMSQELLDAIDADRPSTKSRSEWVREAAQERLNTSQKAESSGSEPEDTGASA